MKQELGNILFDIGEEVNRASKKHKPLNSLHESYAVIKEEFDEFWQEVKKQQVDPHRIKEELIQTAAMCVRTLMDINLIGT